MEASLPGDKPGQKLFSSTWTYPRPQIGPLEPFTKVWSRDTMRAEDKANWSRKRTMPWEEGYGD
jgi:hypothetical protein